MIATRARLNCQSALRALSASALFIAFLIAPGAQALFVDFDDIGASLTPVGGVDIMLGGHAAIVTTVVFNAHQGPLSGASGDTGRLLQTIEFVDGPVTISFGAAPQLSIQQITRLIISDAPETSMFSGFDITPRSVPANPVPEPGAALLFAAGLTATAVRRRRH